MKLSLIIFLFISSVTFGMHEVLDFGTNEGNLKMFIHIPIKVSVKSDIVIVLHGCNQTAEEVSIQSGWNKIADEQGFIVVYPQQRVVNNSSKCFNWFLKKDVSKEGGELSSIIDMLDFTVLKYQLESPKEYLYGLSAGAAMATTIIATFPDRFEAGASLAGGPVGYADNGIKAFKMMNNPPDLSISEWGSLLPESNGVELPLLIVVHGEKDRVVDFDNCNQLKKQWLSSVNSEGIQGIDTTIGKVKRSEFTSTESTIVITYEIPELGHKLPVDPGSDENQGGEEGRYTKDVNFFSTYYIAKDFGLID